MTLTARERSGLALTALTRLAPDDVLDLLKSASTEVGGDISLFASAAVNTGARVQLDRRHGHVIEFSVVAENTLCLFSAEVAAGNNGTTRLRVGGLEKYRVTQARLYGSIPSGPEIIAGYDTYRMFLRRVAERITAGDGEANVTIGLPCR